MLRSIHHENQWYMTYHGDGHYISSMVPSNINMTYHGRSTMKIRSFLEQKYIRSHGATALVAHRFSASTRNWGTTSPEALKPNWLVGQYTHPSEKYDFVNWDD